DIYGLTELGGPGVAVECHQHDGLHIFEDHFFAETVDPDTGKPVARGKEGELVLTSLTRRGTPVLRYRTRDLTILSDGPCKCGNPFVRMLKVRGRTKEMVGLTVEVTVLSPGVLPRTEGKARRVIDRRELDG